MICGRRAFGAEPKSNRNLDQRKEQQQKFRTFRASAFICPRKKKYSLPFPHPHSIRSIVTETAARTALPSLLLFELLLIRRHPARRQPVERRTWTMAATSKRTVIRNVSISRRSRNHFQRFHCGDQSSAASMRRRSPAAAAGERPIARLRSIQLQFSSDSVFPIVKSKASATFWHSAARAASRGKGKKSKRCHQTHSSLTRGRRRPVG